MVVSQYIFDFCTKCASPEQAINAYFEEVWIILDKLLGEF